MEPMEYRQPIQRGPAIQPVEPVYQVERVERPTPLQSQSAGSQVWTSYRMPQIVYLVAGIIDTLLVIRLVLKLLAANPAAGFTTLIYGVTNPFVALFEGVFSNAQSQGNVLDLAALLAIIVYGLLAWGIVRGLEILQRRRS
ncbi:MAG: YggT family protein [Ktedonobacterales bacterium]